MSFDSVTLGLLWDRLISISDEIVETLVRTSFSTIVREGYDLSVMLFDRTGAMMVQGTRSIPVFIGTAPDTLAFMLEKFPPETLAPGDVRDQQRPDEGHRPPVRHRRHAPGVPRAARWPDT